MAEEKTFEKDCERKYVERCNICGESIETTIKRKVKEAFLKYENFLKGYYKNPKYEMILNIHIKELKRIFEDK